MKLNGATYATYTYDAVGNRSSSHLSASYSYQPFNKLTGTATGTYTFDNNGNLLTKTDSLGTTTFTWNEENQLAQVSLPGGLTISYKYDGLGRRIQRTTSAGANERYVYDGRDVLLDLNADWSVTTTYLNDLGIDYHLRQTNSVSGVSYFLTDHLGSTSALTNATGNLVEQITFDSFGNNTGSLRTRYTYTGREADPDTGLLYYRARFYDQKLGRFISEDPIGFEGGDVNLYVYVHNNPIWLIDPFGKQSRSDSRWQPGEIEQMRRLGDQVRSMGSCPRKTNTYLCCRNIMVNAFTEIFSQATGVKHCFLKTGSKVAGMGQVGAGPLPLNPYGVPTQINDHSAESAGADCVPICDVDEKCVDQELEIGKSTGKWSLSNNCNTIANDIIKKCKKPCK